MADTNFRGPVNSLGATMDGPNTGTGTSAMQPQPLDGPSLSYQGDGFPDPRFVPFSKDQFRPGQTPGIMFDNRVMAVDGLPQAATTTLLGAAQLVTAGTAMALTSTQAAGVSATQTIAINVPIKILGSTTITTAPITLDFGFATGTTTAGSTTVVVSDNTHFTLNQWVFIAGAGNASATAPLAAQVVAIATANATGITLSQAAVTGLASVPIGAGDLFGSQFLPPATQFGPSAASAASAAPYIVAGLAKVMNPREMIARNVSVTVGTTTATTSFVVTGYDVWKQPMVETIGPVIATNRAFTTFFGSKAFKHILSVVPTTTAVGTASVGVGDVFGFPFKSANWEFTNIFWNGGPSQTKLGYTAAATTDPATATTGDVRGTIQVSTNGTGSATPVATAIVSNGTARLTIFQTFSPQRMLATNPTNTVQMFGVTNASSA